MSLTTEQFRRSFFYAGSGTDLQPLLRFSALTDTFIYVCADEDLTPECVTASIAEKVANLNAVHPNSLALTGPPVPIHLRDLEHEVPRRWQTHLRRPFAENVRDTFSRFDAPENWGLEFSFVRQLGWTQRPLRLLFLSGEALATYLALSRNGRCPPTIFCAIQTGELDYGDGVMAQFFAHHEQIPDLWVRGVWLPRHQDECFKGRLARVLTGTTPFPHFAQTYDNWDSRLGSLAIPCGHRGENEMDTCIVRAFASHPLWLPLATHFSHLTPTYSAVRVLYRRLEPAKWAKFDAVFASQRMVNRWTQEAGEKLPAKVRALLPSMRRGAHPQLHTITLSLSDALEQVRCAAAEAGARNVALVATGFEDEGTVLRDWARLRPRNFRLDVFAAEPLDFADLRGWRPHRN